MSIAGVLAVTVVEAKNLSEEIDLCNPWVQLILDMDHNYQATKTINGDSNPKFDTKFTFNVQGHEKLKVKVWDEDLFNKDILIGEYDIDISKVISKNYIDAWFDLTKDILEFESKGEIHLIIEFIPK
ncbi:hypothetical protein RhiirA1_452620 [Rhizophagus irregularis]|uniref:C2 domain-containing protein n=2 Tax=Rhizophagus irregularis TaxID=588596 RepID=A0A2N0S9K1_9GLOM|nr:hypothetical protein RhiirA1_452620 [Rhizophagus irregularis]UZO16399.1 hypothetical protein OCT59_007788 [Rhizophagus irregularis]GBC36058.2 protein kinase C alpha type-like isoform X5 [Rhizophagus irregularis DAOM 181602=DAOM 197198]CAB4493153.1 unnamed protein product [Rhizophagus irregularis]